MHITFYSDFVHAFSCINSTSVTYPTNRSLFCFSDIKNLVSMSEALVRVVSDMFVTCDVQNWARLHERKEKHMVFNYVFDYASRGSAPWARVPHIREIEFMFARPFSAEAKTNYNADDRHVSSYMVFLWKTWAHIKYIVFTQYLCLNCVQIKHI